MRNKNLIYTVITLIVLSVGAGIYFTREDASSDNDQGKEMDVEANLELESDQKDFPVTENDPETKKLESEDVDSLDITLDVDSEEVDEIKTEGDGKVLVSDDFSIDLPQGWEGRPAPMGASAMAINVNEEINDPAAKKINFQSYFAVSYDTLQERSNEEYIQYTKDSLTLVSPEISFAEEKQMTIGSKDAYAIEVGVTRQGIDFKILLILVWTE